MDQRNGRIFQKNLQTSHESLVTPPRLVGSDSHVNLRFGSLHQLDVRHDVYVLRFLFCFLLLNIIFHISM